MSHNVLIFITLFNLTFWVSIVGLVYNRNNIFFFLISIEIAYLMIILLFAVSSSNSLGLIENQSYCLLLFILAASDSVVGLAILINCYHFTRKLTFSNNQILHG